MYSTYNNTEYELVFASEHEPCGPQVVVPLLHYTILLSGDREGIEGHLYNLANPQPGHIGATR